MDSAPFQFAGVSIWNQCILRNKYLLLLFISDWAVSTWSHFIKTSASQEPVLKVGLERPQSVTGQRPGPRVLPWDKWLQPQSVHISWLLHGSFLQAWATQVSDSTPKHTAIRDRRLLLFRITAEEKRKGSKIWIIWISYLMDGWMDGETPHQH